MIHTSFIGLLNNAAYLLAIVLLYDSFARKSSDATMKSLLLQGGLLGGVGIAVMSTPWVLQAGAIFDTRSVVLSIGGLFFGLIPTVTAVIITGLFRFFQGGIGAFTGISVIITSGLIGLLWQKKRKKSLERISGIELYLFGVVVGVNMLLWMLTLPPDIARKVLKNISLPVMFIYPLATLSMGSLLRMRLIRKQENMALQQSEDRFRAFYELNLVGLALTSPEKGWLSVNQGLCTMLGYQEEELKKMTWAELTHPEDIEVDVLQFEKMLAGTINGYEMEKRFISKDGAVVFAKLVVRCVRKEGGAVDYVVAMVEDITHRKNLENELVNKEKLFRSLIENQRELIVSFDGDFHLLYANPAYCQTFGKTEEELVGSSFMPIIHEDDQQRVKSSLERLKKPPHNSRHEERARTVLGWRWFEWQVEAMLDEAGAITGTVAVGRDITAQKAAEQALEKSTDEWNYAMDFFEDAIYLIDLDDKILRANQAFYTLTGLSSTEAIGRDITTIIHPQGEPDPCPVCQARINREDAFVSMEHDHPDNPIGKPIEVMVKMIRNEGGEVVSVLMGIHDLSRQRHLEQEIIKHRDHLEELVKERTAQLQEKNIQLHELNKHFTGRELRMAELKEEIELLKKKAEQ
ncbi:MAG: PAS domain S-box protein [Desulfobulbaceae bacterium]|uniref:PAS domain S-box protein n=1 Tax=Candidatus Desulfobia pelagia TaxID=2841692 RepID=A0A8J6NHQ3_9BACT|nr:PAS domain S-box protein [Candidatus Desulfobia pelagia]